MEFIREDCIYARQSVDRKDSISIESQIDFCKYELKGGSCRVFKDKGYSGKNTDRPEFQKLLGEIRKGKVRRVIVYKLDRISRSILDFATMMELLAGRKNQMRALWVCSESHPCTKQHRIFPLYQTDGKQRLSGLRENPQRRI